MSDRDAARRLLRELLPELLEEALHPAGGSGSGRANGNGHGARDDGPQSRVNDSATGAAAAPVPSVLEPAVLRPSTWDRPAAPGEVVGDALGLRPENAPLVPAPGAAGRGAREGLRSVAGTEWVTLDSDEDLDRFVRSLVARFENPRDRMAVRAGTLRFALRRAAADGGPGGASVRVEKGAATERTVAQAAAAGARLVLAPRAVLTPLAREKARALGVEIEKERRC